MKLKNKPKSFTILLCLLSMQFTIQAQDIHFSQFYMSPLTLNPALAGATHDLDAAINYKNQWQSIAAPYKTTGASFDMRFNKKRGTGFWAVGVNFYSDKAGDAQMGTAQANLTLAYHVFLSQYSTLGAGIQGGYAQRSINYSVLQWGNQFDGMSYNPALYSGEPLNASNSISYFDGGTGLDWNYDNTSGGASVTGNNDKIANVGIALFHVNQPNYSFYGQGEKLYMRYVLHGDGVFSIANSNIALRPGFMYSMQGSATELYFGTLVRYMLKQGSKYTGAFKSSAISIGGYYRSGDAFVADMLIEYSNYGIGVSYDFNVSGLSSVSSGRGGMEISLRYVLPNPFSGGGSKAMF